MSSLDKILRIIYALYMHKENWMSNQYSKRLKSSRLKKGVNQKDLAYKFSVDQSTISRIETGKMPREKLRKRIVEYICDCEAQLDLDRVTEIIVKSDEVKTLVARIASELKNA